MINANKLFVVGVLAITISVVVGRCVYTVKQTESAILIMFGNPQSVEKAPGLHFKNPLSNVVKIDNRNLEFDLDNPEEILDVNQEKLTVDAFARYRIVDPLVYYQRFRALAGGSSNALISGGESVIERIMRSSLRQTFGAVTYEDIVTNLRAELMVRIETRMQEQLREYGVEMIDVKVRKADFPNDIAETVYNTMRSERLEKAQLIRSEGERDATRIRAEAERRRAEIEAKANQQSLEIQGKADGRRSAIFNEAYSKDPEFYAFYRSMLAYEAALESGETTILLSPNSEFFRYFNNQSGNRSKN